MPPGDLGMNEVQIYNDRISKSGFRAIIIYAQVFHLESVEVWRDFDSNGLTVEYLGAGPMSTALTFRHRFGAKDPIDDFIAQLANLGAKPFILAE